MVILYFKPDIVKPRYASVCDVPGLSQAAAIFAFFNARIWF
jgi:hypothetical protein